MKAMFGEQLWNSGVKRDGSELLNYVAIFMPRGHIIPILHEAKAMLNQASICQD